jgi:hypothetical protein
MDETGTQEGKERKMDRRKSASHQKITARASSTIVAFVIEPNEIENNQVFELFGI